MKPAVKGELGWKSADVVLPEGLQVLVNTKGQVITKMRRWRSETEIIPPTHAQKNLSSALWEADFYLWDSVKLQDNDSGSK